MFEFIYVRRNVLGLGVCSKTLPGLHRPQLVLPTNHVQKVQAKAACAPHFEHTKKILVLKKETS